MLITGTALYVFATPIVRFMNPDPAVVVLSAQCLRMAAIIQPVQTLGWTFAGALRGAGDSKWTFYITAFSNWVVRVLPTVLVIYVFKLGLPEAVFFMCAEQAARCLLLFFRYRTGKWETLLEKKKSQAAKA